MLTWLQLAATHKRTIEIVIPDSPRGRNYHINPDNVLKAIGSDDAKNRARCLHQAPGMMGACKESRDEGKKIYEVICNVPFTNPAYYVRERRPVYMNLDVDLLAVCIEGPRSEARTKGDVVDDVEELLSAWGRWTKQTTTRCLSYYPEKSERPLGAAKITWKIMISNFLVYWNVNEQSNVEVGDMVCCITRAPIDRADAALRASVLKEYMDGHQRVREPVSVRRLVVSSCFY